METGTASNDDKVLGEVVGLVGGELLEGLSIGEPSFEHWLAVERERFRLLIVSIYGRLMDGAERSGRLEEALNFGLKSLSLDPLQESVHRGLMRFYAAQGRYDAALSQYERCRRDLSNQLSVQPEPETEELARSLRTSRRDAPAKPQRPLPLLLDDGPSDRLPQRPSIVVLPFTNLSGNPEQQYIGDGITEDIITELSRYRSLLVIARNSSFQFRGPTIDFGAVRGKLAAHFVVEGSIRKIGSRLRLTVQLIDAATEGTIWAERYDREADEIFAVQDDMTRAIAATLEGRIAASGAEQARRRPTTGWAAYDFFLQGREHFNRYNLIQAEPFFARAVELDPAYARAYAMWANALLGKYWNEPRAETMDQALECARKALSLDDADPWCHCMLAFILMLRGQRDLAGLHFDRAVALNPTDVQIASLRAVWVARGGRTNEALEILDTAMRRDPFPPLWFWEVRAIALLHERRYEEVIDSLSRMIHLNSWNYAYIAACHAYLDRLAEARASASEVLRVDRISR